MNQSNRTVYVGLDVHKDSIVSPTPPRKKTAGVIVYLTAEVISTPGVTGGRRPSGGRIR